MSKKEDELRDALVPLIHAYIANLGDPDNEFITCITPPHRKSAKKDDKCWRMWDRAIDAVGGVDAVERRHND